MKALSLLVILFASSTVWAEAIHPAYELPIRPEENVAISMPTASIINVSGKGKNSVNSSGTQIGAEYLKGVKGSWAVGGGISYLDLGSKAVSQKGLNDFEVYAKSQVNFKNNESVIYGATGYLSPDKARLNGSSANSFSGGYAVEPYVGLVEKGENASVTIALSYKAYLQDRDAVVSGLNGMGKRELVTKIGGGSLLKAGVGVDVPYKQGSYGLTLAATSKAAESVKNLTKGSTENAVVSEAYYMIPASPTAKFIPSLTYIDANSKAGGYTGFAANFAYLAAY